MSNLQERIYEINEKNRQAREEQQKKLENEQKEAKRKERKDKIENAIDKVKSTVKTVVEGVKVKTRVKTVVEGVKSSFEERKQAKENERVVKDKARQEELEEKNKIKADYNNFEAYAEATLDRVGTFEKVEQENGNIVTAVYTELGPIIETIHKQDGPGWDTCITYEGFAKVNADPNADVAYTKLSKMHWNDRDWGQGLQNHSDAMDRYQGVIGNDALNLKNVMVDDNYYYNESFGVMKERYNAIKKTFESEMQKIKQVQEQKEESGPQMS